MSAAQLLHGAIGAFPEIEALPRKRFTRDDVERMESAGLFEGQRWELIDGELIDKMGQNPPHSFALQLLVSALLRFLDSAMIRVQSPIEAFCADRERSLPEPDVAVIEPSPEHKKRNPRGDEVL